MDDNPAKVTGVWLSQLAWPTANAQPPCPGPNMACSAWKLPQRRDERWACVRGLHALDPESATLPRRKHSELPTAVVKRAGDTTGQQVAAQKISYTNE
eukprot:364003-Chlamydomonas_euryale.AAC.14